MPAWPAPWLRSRYGPAGASPASAQARRLGRSKHHFHKRVRGECLVQVIELLAAGGCHRDGDTRSEEHTSELQSQSNLVCRLLLEKKKKITLIRKDQFLDKSSPMTAVAQRFAVKVPS